MNKDTERPVYEFEGGGYDIWVETDSGEKFAAECAQITLDRLSDDRKRPS